VEQCWFDPARDTVLVETTEIEPCLDTYPHLEDYMNTVKSGAKILPLAARAS
jgi:hypothetical protein